MNPGFPFYSFAIDRHSLSAVACLENQMAARSELATFYTFTIYAAFIIAHLPKRKSRPSRITSH
jgi:hypothetical protein